MSVYAFDQIYTKYQTDQKHRYKDAEKNFKKRFGIEPTRFFSAPGRTEIGGNHTDHNNGCVMAASVSLDVIAAVVPTDDNIIQVKSQGFPIDTINLSDLEVHKKETNLSCSLIRGVAAGFAKNGHKIGGFKAYTSSTVLKGSGLSSSAAFEVLIATILNGLYNNHSVPVIEVAQISQYAENVYFGKPSGLLDQMASAVGGFITVDFADSEKPVLKEIKYDFAKSGYHLCIVDTKGHHADLTHEYASIPAEMKSVAQYFSKDVLREITKDMIMKDIVSICKKCGHRAVLRALHFMDDNERVLKEAKALNNNKFKEFLSLVNESGKSSYMYLQNIFACSDPKEQGLSLGLYLANQLLDGDGACRVHGGGFGGTIQAFVPGSKLGNFCSEMNRVFGAGSCYVLSIRQYGGVELDF